MNRKLGFSILLLAGFCGGMAEVVWVASYAAVTGLSGIEVARQVTASVFPSMAKLPLAPLLGIVIHFALSVGLAIAFGLLVWRPFANKLTRPAGALVAISFLCLLWVINFFIVLPTLNPVFVTLMPYPVTLLSKALFGGAMVWALQVAPRKVSTSRAASALIGICRVSYLSRTMDPDYPPIGNL